MAPLRKVRSLDQVANGELDVALNGIPHNGVRSVVRSVDVRAGAVREVLEQESRG